MKKTGFLVFASMSLFAFSCYANSVGWMSSRSYEAEELFGDWDVPGAEVVSSDAWASRILSNGYSYYYRGSKTYTSSDPEKQGTSPAPRAYRITICNPFCSTSIRYPAEEVNGQQEWGTVYETMDPNTRNVTKVTQIGLYTLATTPYDEVDLLISGSFNPTSRILETYDPDGNLMSTVEETGYMQDPYTWVATSTKTTTYNSDGSKTVEYPDGRVEHIAANGQGAVGKEMKRIYTVEEAERVSKKEGNIIKIRYK